MENIFLKSFPVLTPNLEVKTVSLEDLLWESKKTLLYFYPKDNTPWCTLENKDFTCLRSKFLDLWINLIWVSGDSIEDHKKFISEHKLWNFLISDETLELHKFFWVYWEKNNYWKIVTWVIRSTFLLDKNWNILKSWKNVKATNHAEKILKEVI